MGHLVDLIREYSKPLAPVETSVSPYVVRLPDIRAVLFDVYGTLLVSGSGDVGVGSTPANRAQAAQEAFAALSRSLTWSESTQLVELLHEVISRHHEAARRDGADHPEVDIVAVWREAVRALPATSNLVWSDDQLARLSVEFELRVNPIWPMPGAAECVQRLASAGFLLGIVSNAQFFTPLMWQAMTSSTFTDQGFDPALQYFSYVGGVAKPSPQMYREATGELAGRGVKAGSVLYVGNDMRNDVAPARAVGFRTALFAGDQRSLRMRPDDPDLAHVTPDVVITDLLQILDVVGVGGEERLTNE